MAALDILRSRTQRRTRTAQVLCRELGLLTVEALSLKEAAALSRGEDADRAVLYAACRELQEMGEVLRREGSLFTPDEIMQFLTDEEAAVGAEAVRELSGVSPGQPNSEEGVRPESVQKSGKQSFEVRQDIVQSETDVPEKEIRPESVQSKEVFQENRAGRPVEALPDGQVSHEFLKRTDEKTPLLSETSERKRSPKAAQKLVSERKKETQDVAAEIKTRAKRAASALPRERAERTRKGEEPALNRAEKKPEKRDIVHEITSELKPKVPEVLHEIKSDSRETVHEITSENPEKSRETVHEMKSESEETVHDTTSESAPVLHEIKSENREKAREDLHETESDLAEQVARRLLEGLRRAADVR